MSTILTPLSFLVVFLTGLLPTSEVFSNTHQPASCVRCHQGIESIGEMHEGLDCVDCHQGSPDGVTKEAAHVGLYVNPGDLNIVDNTCGICHEDIVGKVKMSLHATMAGVISGSRYLWAAQKEMNAVYAIRPVSDNDKNVPAELGAVKSLQALPHYKDSKQPIDDYLRNQCLRCHLWTKGSQQLGDYRSSGCSACHVLYADNGLSRSGDKTIPKDKPSHPIRHEITAKIPSQQCVHCHNRGGRTGVSFLGMMESDGYGTPFNPDGTTQTKLHGKHYNYLQKDVHYEKGMDCIDCHTINDIHGDGNIYSKREQAVEIECTDCHGTIDNYSTLRTTRNNIISNLKKQNEDVMLTGKVDGRIHNVQQIRSLADRHALPVAMRIKGHTDKLECYACHSRWAPQCYGCHVKMDTTIKGYDWVDESKDRTHQWEESRSYLRWETPILGINSESNVSPFIAGCQVIFTHIGSDGNIVSNKIFTNAAGHSGIAHNPIQPHTVSRKARTCENCHSEPKALGLGSGYYVSKYNGLDISFELERIVDEDGNQIQGTSHVGARPFNKEEIERIKRVNACLGCHQETPTIFWEKVIDKWGKAKNSKVHHDVLKELIRGATGLGMDE
ncbi:MAG: hypothetical protein HYV35_02230 [Lentisphaerae bacterium]|nr:hypothetical protein [Lentisphaerota bacterium]